MSNWIRLTALSFAIATMVVPFPLALHQRHQLKEANERLLNLQQKLRETQDQIARAQSDLTKTQSEIEKAIKGQ